MSSTLQNTETKLYQRFQHHCFNPHQWSILKRLGYHLKTLIAGVAKLWPFKRWGSPVEATLWNGQSMTVVLPEGVSEQLFLHGVYEPEITATLWSWLKPGDLFIDVGAHYGYYSVMAAARVGEQGQVLAVEPMPRTVTVLKQNATAYPSITVLHKAAWNESTQLTFHDYGPEYAAYSSHWRPKIKEPNRGKIQCVETVVLDEYLQEMGGMTPALIKIDAESAELNVLKGLQKTLTHLSPRLIIEMGDHYYAGTSPIKSSDVIEFLMSLCYLPFEFFQGRWQPHQILEAYEYTNLLFSKYPLPRVDDEVGIEP